MLQSFWTPHHPKTLEYSLIVGALLNLPPEYLVLLNQTKFEDVQQAPKRIKQPNRAAYIQPPAHRDGFLGDPVSQGPTSQLRTQLRTGFRTAGGFTQFGSTPLALRPTHRSRFPAIDLRFLPLDAAVRRAAPRGRRSHRHPSRASRGPPWFSRAATSLSRTRCVGRPNDQDDHLERSGM